MPCSILGLAHTVVPAPAASSTPACYKPGARVSYLIVVPVSPAPTTRPTVVQVEHGLPRAARHLDGLLVSRARVVVVVQPRQRHCNKKKEQGATDALDFLEKGHCAYDVHGGLRRLFRSAGTHCRHVALAQAVGRELRAPTGTFNCRLYPQQTSTCASAPPLPLPLPYPHPPGTCKSARSLA